VEDEAYWDGLDSFWWCVNLFVEQELSGNLEINLASIVDSRIFGPHASKLMSNGVESVLSGPSFDQVSMRGNSAVPSIAAQRSAGWGLGPRVATRGN